MVKELTLELALKMLEAAERWARDIAGFPCSIAVVDQSGTILAVHRMDGAETDGDGNQGRYG